jgi:Mg-chelatase subunit ChlD
MSLRFENDFLKKLEYLHVVSKRALAGQNRADRLSPKRGRGLEFADHRPYAAGDDYRHIDWKAYQRLNRLLLRLFDEERDLSIYLMLDVSRSMAEPAKFDMARRIAAALCYVGLAHLDRLTIIPFGTSLGHESAPGRGKGRIFRVFETLEKLEASGPTDLRAAFKAFASRPRQLGLVVVISDFLEAGSSAARQKGAGETESPKESTKEISGPQAGLKILRTIGHDVFAVQVTSERDRDPGVLGTVRFVDVETGELKEIEVTPRLAAAYVKASETHADALEHFCGRYDIGYVRAEAERPFEDVILRTFRQGRFLA